MARIQRKTIAQALGVDPAIVSRDAKRGMPTHSIEAARAWREQHVRPRSPALPDGPPARPGPLLAIVAELADATDPADVEALRAAIALLPEEMRGRVRLPVETWKLLLGRQVLADFAGQAPADPPVDDAAVGAALCRAILAPLGHA